MDQVRTQIEQMSDNLTPAERKLATALLADYPFAGLESIQSLADRAEVSAPSISRFVNKLGYGGFIEFQRQLIEELKTAGRSPVDLHRDSRQVTGAYLEDFIARATEQMSAAAAAITETQFVRVCDMLADPRRAIYVLGGRVSDTIAFHLSFHLRQIRRDVFHLPSSVEVWPEYLLRMKPRDVLFIADFRRYQPSLARLARSARQERGAHVVVLTDKWMSPATKHGTETLAVPIESETLWDTYTAALAVMEAIVTRIAEDNWAQTRDRIEAWDALRFQEAPSANDP